MHSIVVAGFYTAFMDFMQMLFACMRGILRKSIPP